MLTELRELKTSYEDLLTAELKTRYDRLYSLTRDLSKLYTEDNRSGKNLLHSLQDDIHQFRRKVLAESKIARSDYESFIWKCKREKKKENLGNFEFLKINKPATDYPSEAQLLSLSFQVLGYSNKQLIDISSRILTENQFCKENYPNTTIITNLIQSLASGYNIVSYHNFSHAFSVFLMIHQLQKLAPQFTEYFSQFEIFITKVAALAHDLAHNGTNSLFQIKRKSQLATIYSNESILQNMHISKFYQLLRENNSIDIISQIEDTKQRERAKELIMVLILSTDMAQHLRGLEEISAKIKSNSLDTKLKQGRNQILQVMFHGCDIGNSCLEYNQYLNWAVLLSYEFNDQAEREVLLNLEVTPYLRYESNTSFFRGQIGFMNGFSLPLWKQISTIFPGAQSMYANILKNKSQIQQQLNHQVSS